MSILWITTWLLINLFGSILSECNDPLGMENGKITDDQITASHWLHYATRSKHFGPHLSRLNMKSASGSWCTEDIIKFKNPFIQVDLLQNKRIKGFSTQGRDNGSSQSGAEEYTERFRIMYQRENEDVFRKYNESGKWKVFDGNTDNINTIHHVFEHHVIARKIRIYTYGEEFAIHCLRFELYGCPWQHSSSGLVSYDAPRGGERRGVNLQDIAYDGTFDESAQIMKNGLGKLTDDIFGKKALITKHGSPWVGFNSKNPDLKFSFSDKRLLKQVLIHINNNGVDIELFEKLDIYISSNDEQYTFLRTYQPTQEERNHKDAFAIIVELGSEVLTKYIKLSFTTKTSWLVLSEVLFISDTYPPTDEHLLPTKGKPNILIFTEKPVDEKTTSNEKATTAGLSFPIILTIALVTFVLAVVVGIFIYKSYKKKRKHDREPRPIIPTQPQIPQQYQPSLNKQGLLYEEQLVAMQQQMQHQHNALLANGMYIQQPRNSFNTKIVMG